ncbi:MULTISPECIES: PL29 family lyase N-terminal domain-containing protein [Butyricimonas]|uniref:PL29 family lyase N-terminal domain-containing protein n=1 Tax=Butyricimonas TaxID=574697 RepID=UPI0007FB3066|nr:MULTISPECIES: PL29 family lyase N-terminal domain-containing protein [Butyricimonas]
MWNLFTRFFKCRHLIWLSILCVAFAGCKDDFDDSELRDQIADLDGRLTTLEKLCAQMNTNISSMQTIVNALQQNDYITGVTPIMEGGNTIGYTITFMKNKPITIYHGKDGEKGEDGITPRFKIENGRWMVSRDNGSTWEDAGQATGEQGLPDITFKLKIENGRWLISWDNGATWEDVGQATGDQGQQGAAGITPQFKIEFGNWFVSFDHGTNWSLLGQATGDKGEDGITPVIGIKQDTDGIYYWTLNGTWLLDDNNQKVKAEGTDGKDGHPGEDGKPGQDGTPGKNGITPLLKIENEHWWLSYNNGETWTDLGQAKGDDGENFFKEIDNSSDSYIIITLLDNTTIKLPKLNPLEIHFDTQDLITIANKGSRDIHYTTSNADENTTVEVISTTDLKAKVIAESPSKGVIHIEALGSVDEYSHVLVFISDSESRVTMAKLTFEESVIKYTYNSNYEVAPEGGIYPIHFLTNTEYEVIVEEPATSWISAAPQSRTIENHEVSLFIQPNTGEFRTGTVIVRDKHSNMQLAYTIMQTAPLEKQLKKEREALMDLYNATNGTSWTKQTNWGSDKPVSEWHGINCRKDGTIYEIDLGSNNLSGELPASIGEFDKIFFIDLSENQLTGALPQEIGNLKQLLSLKISRNNFTNLDALKLCPSISLLEIGVNKFSNPDNCFEIISQLIHLDYLSMFGNANFCGPLPPSITKIMDLPLLNHFDINLCGFGGNIPTEVLQHPRWNDFVFHILPQTTMDNQPIGSSIGGFNMEGITYKIADFSVKDINDATLDSRVLKQNKLTLIFPITSGNEYGLRKTQALHKDYREKGLGIISFFRLWTPQDPAEKEEEEKWVQDIIKKYDMPWHNFIEDSYTNRIHNLPRYWTSSSGPDNSYPSGCIIVDSEGYVLYNADIDGTDGVRDFIESMLGRIDTYESTDYSRDGEIKTIQTASLGNGIDLVLLGDGFTDRDIADGSYDQIMEKAAENFFSSEPIASYRSYFNARSVKVVSKHGRFSDGHETALSCKFEGGTLITGDDNKCMEYARKISNYDPSRTVILVVLNDNRYAGTCYMYHANNLSIAYCPTVDGYSSERFVQIINHEAVGHGFAKLGDEYYHEQNGAIPVNVIENYRQEQTNGWWNNIDFTINPEEISWKSFLTDNRYRTENLGIFEGALTYPQNVYKSTTNSIMNTNTGIFNAPSREAIYKRIMQLVHGNDWQYSYEDFVAQDLKNIPSATSKARMPQGVPAEFVPLHPPVVKR